MTTTISTHRSTSAVAPTGWHAFAGGARAMLPLLAGIVPFGMVVGVTAAGSGMPFAGWSTGVLIYAGSAQLAAIGLLHGGASVGVVVMTVAAINLRLLLYAGVLAREWRGTSRRWRALAAYLLVDPSFVVGMAGYERGGPARPRHLHYLGGACVLWLAWQLSAALGLAVGAIVPAGLHLEMLVPLYLVTEIVPKLTSASVRVAAAVGVVAAVAGSVLPLNLGLAAAIVAGVAAGMLRDRRAR